MTNNELKQKVQTLESEQLSLQVYKLIQYLLLLSDNAIGFPPYPVVDIYIIIGVCVSSASNIASGAGKCQLDKTQQLA